MRGAAPPSATSVLGATGRALVAILAAETLVDPVPVDRSPPLEAGDDATPLPAVPVFCPCAAGPSGRIMEKEGEVTLPLILAWSAIARASLTASAARTSERGRRASTTDRGWGGVERGGEGKRWLSAASEWLFV